MSSPAVPSPSQQKGRLDQSKLLILLAFVAIVGKIGDAFGLALVNSHPLLLLILNANDLHCALTYFSVSFVPWMLVASLRRMCEDPLFYYIGWKYRIDALDWLHTKYPQAVDSFRNSENVFRQASYAAIVLNPSNVICCLAGISQVQPEVFTILITCGIIGRLSVIRGLCMAFPDQLEMVLDTLHGYLPFVLVAAVAVTIATSVTFWNSGKASEPTKESTKESDKGSKES